MRQKWFVLIAVAGLLAAAGEAGVAQSAWPFELRWEHDGANVTHFDLCVDGRCEIAPAQRVSDSATWNLSLPTLPEGEHRLVVRACNHSACTSGHPDVFVRVTPVQTGPPQPVPSPPSKAKPRPRARPGN